MENLSVDEIRERYMKTRSADIYDVLDSMGYPDQCLDLGIKPIRNDMKIAGPALTLCGTRDPQYLDVLNDPKAQEKAFQLFLNFTPGCVIVINAEKEDNTGHWGEMMSYGARNMGAAGIVIDGGIRDKQGLLDMPRWSCFVRYTTPIEARRRWCLKEFNCPIYMTGTLTSLVRVNPGDWIFGDCDGVLVIPVDIVCQVLEKVEDITRREDLSRIDFEKGEQFLDVLTKYGRA